MQRTYLDWNATAPLRPEAKAAALNAFEFVGNPSSVHAEGRAARTLIETARAQVAALVGSEPNNVFFTSGGTEANGLALTPSIGPAGERDHLWVSTIEHPSVLHAGRFSGARPGELPVGSDGVIDLTALSKRIAQTPRPLVSVMLANNETGVVQPISEVAARVHEAGGLLHVDAVQGPGRLSIDMAALGADLLTLSAHKIGGPKGAGALIRRDERIHIADPLLKGGGQERGWRAGTENLPGIVGFGVAAEAVSRNSAAEIAAMARLREALERGLRNATPDVLIFGEAAPRLPNTTLFTRPGLKAETAVIAFDLEGIAVSSGAACSSGKVQPSHVLAAMGVDQALARGAIRVSLGPATAGADIELFLKAWIKLSKSLGKGRGIAA